jgi:UDP-glucose 4-epimerase
MATKKKKSILITGIGGGLAHHVINKLKDDYEVIGVDFKERAHYDESVKYYRIDFSKRGFEEVFRKHKFDGVIHLGRILLYKWNRLRRYNTNVLGTQRLFDLCNKYKVKKVIVLSTFYVYGAHPYNPSLIDEMFPLKASNNSADLADAVELENLSTIYMLKYPDLNLTILRPCNIVGPQVQNSVSLLLMKKYAPSFLGFSPIMQFIHVDDLADAIILSYKKIKSGIYNVVNDDWIPYQKALEMAGCKSFPIAPFPPILSKMIVSVLNYREFPPFLLNYYKYPVILDGNLFKKTFDFKPKYALSEIFEYYKKQKSLSLF